MSQVPPVVLVIEDDLPTAGLVRELLEFEGYAVQTATSGAAALDRVAARHIDLILLDLKLPDVDGLALCRQLRTRESEQAISFRVPIIMLTAAADQGIPAACRRAGADGCLLKFFEIDALLGRVRCCIGAPTARCEVG